MLGATFTPERLEGALAWLPSLATLPIYVVIVGGLIFLYLQRTAPSIGRRRFSPPRQAA